MKKLLVVLMLSISFFTALSQSAVILHHNGSSTSFYSNAAFQNACDAALSGDTIYLPGGFFPPPAAINKGLTIIGAGHHPDSAMATRPTIITGTITLLETSDGSSLSGFKIEGSVNIPYANSVDRLKLSRLFITSSISTSGGNFWCTNGAISECIILGDITGASFDQFSITNNVIGYRINMAKNSIISNNIFLGGDPMGSGVRVLYSLDNCVVRNNIFYTAVTDWVGLVSNVIQNNLFANEPAMTGNISSGNFFNVNTAQVFVSYDNTGFKYTHNFHLNSPASYTGTDATQVGLFGTLKPWKAGSIPQNPRIQLKSIAENTDIDGKIQVQVKAVAQNN